MAAYQEGDQLDFEAESDFPVFDGLQSPRAR